MVEQNRLLSHCNRCHGSTSHEVLHQRKVSDEHFDEDDRFYETWTDTYTMIECRGCETVSMKIDHWHSAYGQSPSQLYPPRIARKAPDWIWKLPSEWCGLMREIYGALHANSRRLAVMGSRTVIDLYLTEAVGNHGSFEQRLESLVSTGQLARDDKSTLNAALEAGNAAAHRGHNPNASDLNTALDITEHLLHKYVLKQAAHDLQKSTPPRPSKTR